MLKEFNKMVKMYSQSNIAEAKEFLEKLVFELINLSKKTHVLYREIEKTNRVRIKFSHLLKKWVSGLQFIQSKLKLRSEKFSSLFEGILKNKKQFLEFFNNLIKINKQITAKLSNKSTFSARQYLKEYNRVKNYFIVMLLKLQDALNKASAKQNMQAKGQNMNSLAEMQRQLNEQVKRMWGKAKSGKLSRAEKRYLKKLARKQAEIAKRIGKILKSGGEAAKRLRKALQAIKKEMEQVSKLLEKEKLNRQTVKKQRRILKRMLNSEMGLESKERDKTRKGEIMTQDEFEQDADIKKRFRDFMNKQSPLRQRNFKNLDPYYRKLIREYFKELKKTLNK
jgi:hypothetical protein